MNGASFKMLSVIVDPRLTMHEAVHHLSSEAGWRVQALLRTRRFYDTKAMFRLFKCQILSFLEGATPAIYHAAPAILKPIDDIQVRFLEEMGISSAEALLEHNLAPPSTRRDMAMLGILYNVSRGLGPKPILNLFSLRRTTLEAHGFSTGVARHTHQISDPVAPSHPAFIKRSNFGLVRVLNRLPEDAVGPKNVKSFQRALQNIAKHAPRQGSPVWAQIFQPMV